MPVTVTNLKTTELNAKQCILCSNAAIHLLKYMLTVNRNDMDVNNEHQRLSSIIQHLSKEALRLKFSSI